MSASQAGRFRAAAAPRPRQLRFHASPSRFAQGYVEFQGELAKVLRAHRSALIANRRFWRILVRDNIAFRSLAESFRDMSTYEAAADTAYKSALEKRPRVRRYAADRPDGPAIGIRLSPGAM